MSEHAHLGTDGIHVACSVHTLNIQQLFRNTIFFLSHVFKGVHAVGLKTSYVLPFLNDPLVSFIPTDMTWNRETRNDPAYCILRSHVWDAFHHNNFSD